MKVSIKWTYSNQCLLMMFSNALVFLWDAGKTKIREPEINESSYFINLSVIRMLERIEDNWYPIKDYTRSLEKTKNMDHSNH